MNLRIWSKPAGNLREPVYWTFVIVAVVALVVFLIASRGNRQTATRIEATTTAGRVQIATATAEAREQAATASAEALTPEPAR